MKFEDALAQMRDGKKCQTQYDRDSESYWVCGYQTILNDPTTKSSTIFKVKKDGSVENSAMSWGIPCWMIMDESWEIALQ